MLDFLPMPLYTAIQNINTNLLYEIRLRVNQPIVINFAGQYIYLTTSGTSLNVSMAIVATLQDIEECIYRASDYSIYSVTEQIQQGFITAKCGERIGLAGAYVYEENKLQNIREITSLNIRVPHSVDGAANGIMQACFLNPIHQTALQIEEATQESFEKQIKAKKINHSENLRTKDSSFLENNRKMEQYKNYRWTADEDNSKQIHSKQAVGGQEYSKSNLEKLSNILLCSSAGCGKTTILRDLTKQLSTYGMYNILLSDERNEITAMHHEYGLQFGNGVDVIRYAKKEDALKLGLRAMRPDIIITDEIITRQEVASLLQAYYGGVKIISTVHATHMYDLQNMPILTAALQEKLFDYYIFLKSDSIGQIATIYNKNFQCVYEA